MKDKLEEYIPMAQDTSNDVSWSFIVMSLQCASSGVVVTWLPVAGVVVVSVVNNLKYLKIS
jgi:hypothetical protein